MPKIRNKNLAIDEPSLESLCDVHIAAVIEFLKAEGFRPEPLDSGRVYFKFEGHHVYFAANPGDDQRFDLFIPNIWQVEQEDRDSAIKTAHHVTDVMGCIKVVVVDSGAVWVLYEGFYPSVESFTAILTRAIERLQYGARRFIDVFHEMREARTLQ